MGEVVFVCDGMGSHQHLVRLSTFASEDLSDDVSVSTMGRALEFSWALIGHSPSFRRGEFPKTVCALSRACCSLADLPSGRFDGLLVCSRHSRELVKCQVSRQEARAPTFGADTFFIFLVLVSLDRPRNSTRTRLILLCRTASTPARYSFRTMHAAYS